MIETQIAPDISEETEFELLYRIIIHNDPITPMEFVVQILTSIFYLGNDRATDIMFKAHMSGTAYVQTLPKTEAETRIHKAHTAADLQRFPLQFSLEPE